MDLHLYIPALIVFGAAVLSFFFGLFMSVISFPVGIGRDLRRDIGLALGVCFMYASPAAAMLAIGMQIAHWI
jgi:hypothetical protein